MYRRIYTVGYDVWAKPTKSHEKIPCLRFSGLWLLYKVGLRIGDKVLVLIDHGQIGIIKLDNKEGGQSANTTDTNSTTARRTRAGD